MNKKQHMLIILDGVGLSENEQGNAFKLANTPNIDKYINTYPNSTLNASGTAVGLPKGQMGNSEVGHLGIGSGRVVYQEFTLINKEIKEETFYTNKALLKAIENCKKNNTKLHLMGLVSNGGVHSHQEHLYALLELCRRENFSDVYVHCFTDGRDTGITSAVHYLNDLEKKIKELKVGKIASIVGRYYSMDRDNKYDRLKVAYDLLINKKGTKYNSVQKAIEASYEAEIFDEFIKPTIIEDVSIDDKDSVIYFNFRHDRARVMSRILTDEFEGFERNNLPKDLNFVALTDYDETLNNLDVAFKLPNVTMTLTEHLSNKGLNICKIAETEKYAHVTFFFNGGLEKPFKNEKRILINSPKVATYDLKPEMSAIEVTDKILEELENTSNDLIVVNYANGDMVGHTGILDSAIKAMETVDTCLGKVIDKLVSMDGEAVIIADHGNCESMIEEKTGEPITTHTTSVVPCIVISNRLKSVSNGALCDVAPTILDLMNIDKPNEMTGKSLIEM